MLTVVAALIESDGKLLVCQRRRGTAFELMWEFPGGKLQTGETPAQGLARELREELGVEAEIGAEAYRTRHKYAQWAEPIEVIFLTAQTNAQRIQNIIFERIEWREPHRLTELNFLPADREFVAILAQQNLNAKWRSSG
ncbi:MAG: NUDIX domain-containing protein [Candidatus Acidiferrales bacterium]